MRRHRDIPWQLYVKERQCREQSVQSAAPTMGKVPGSLKSAEVKVTVPLEKPVSVQPHSTYFALAIAVGLSLRAMSAMDMGGMIAYLIDFTGFLAVLMFGMVLYKRANNQKVIW